MEYITTTTIDNKDNKYKKIFFNKTTECIVCLNKQNIAFKGEINISLREGKSIYGNQIVIQFIIDQPFENYLSKSPNQHIEFYFNDLEGINFLKETVKYLEVQNDCKK